MDAVPLTPAVSTRKTKNRPGFRNQSVANASAPVYKWEKKWVAPAGLPEGSTFKVMKWVKTAEKARFPSISADSNVVDDAEDVDMDGDDREGEGDEQDDEEMAKGGDENAPIDISMDQDNSQVPLTSPTTDENTLSTQADNIGQQGSTNPQIALESEDAPQPSGNAVQEASVDQDATPATVSVSSSGEAPQDITMNGASQSGPISQEAPIAESESVAPPATAEQGSPSGMPVSQPMPSSDAATTDDIKLPDVDANPLPEANAPEESVAPMEVEVEQPLERPEDSTDALALPVASSVPMPTHVSAEALLEMSSAASAPMEAPPADLSADVEPTPHANPVQPQATPDVAPVIEESPALEEPSAAEMKRSLTPSPSPERIQEFKEHEAAAEEPTLVPGNLSSPSPQLDPPSIVSPPPAPSNAVEGAVAGSHVTDVQLGRGASGADVGEVALEPTSHGVEIGVLGEVTMEGEADPGKSLGEGDPVGVNGQEEFADEDVRRADDASLVPETAAPGGEEATVVQSEKTE